LHYHASAVKLPAGRRKPKRTVWVEFPGGNVLGKAATLAMLLALGACATVPLADQQADLEGKQFDPPARDSGALYVYSSGWFGLVRKVEISLAGGSTTELAPNTYFRVEGPPGPIDLQCLIDKDRSAGQEFQIAPGETRFVRISMASGWIGPRCVINEVPPDQGQAAVRESKRVVPQ
jgi:hypothetical protein